MTTRPRAIGWLWAAMVASLVGPTLLFLLVAWWSRESTIDDARARLGRVAQVAQEHARRVVETNEVIWRALDGSLGQRSNEELRAGAVPLHQVMRRLASDLTQMQSVWVWDEEGRPIASSLRPDPPATLNVSDREYFVWAREKREAGWFVSQPLQSRTTGQTFFDFCKRREDAQGRFTGAVSVSLRPDYFTSFFEEQVRLESGYAVGLFRADGVVIARFPMPQQTRLGSGSQLLSRMAQGAASGALSGVSTIDNRPRYIAFRRVGDLPLYTVAAADESQVLAGWRKSTAVLAAFTFPLALGLFALCAFALRRVRLQHAMAVAHEREYEHRLRAEEALRQAQKMEALGRLTGGVAHDFNNVLMVVQSSVALARMYEKREQPTAPALSTIERAIANGAQLTRQLLTVARRQPVQLRTVDVGEVLAPVARLMDSTLGSSVQVACHIDEGLPPVRVDPGEFELAVINLCINARDAMPQGGRIEVVARACPSPEHGGDGAWVEVCVSDTGHGIPAHLREKVMEPFFTTKPVGKGTGLGLSQVQSFAQTAQGQVRIDSQEGRGTTVSVLLPGTNADPVSPGMAAEGEVPVLGGDIVLVEDNPDIARSLTLLLEHLGARVSHYLTAEAALRGIESHTVRPDAVLSDISLGDGLTGVDLAQALQRILPDLPILLMTGYTDQLERAAALKFRVLPKPIAPQELACALAEMLRKTAA